MFALLAKETANKLDQMAAELGVAPDELVEYFADAWLAAWGAAIMTIALAAAAVYFAYLAHQKYHHTPPGEERFHVGWLYFLYVVAFFCVFAAGKNTYEALVATSSPKLYAIMKMTEWMND